MENEFRAMICTFTEDRQAVYSVGAEAVDGAPDYAFIHHLASEAAEKVPGIFGAILAAEGTDPEALADCANALLEGGLSKDTVIEALTGDDRAVDVIGLAAYSSDETPSILTVAIDGEVTSLPL